MVNDPTRAIEAGLVAGLSVAEVAIAAVALRAIHYSPRVWQAYLGRAEVEARTAESGSA